MFTNTGIECYAKGKGVKKSRSLNKEPQMFARPNESFLYPDILLYPDYVGFMIAGRW